MIRRRHAPRGPASWRIGGLALSLAALHTLLLAPPASADVDGLCGTRVACSVQVPASWVEGRSNEVVVTGAPGVEATLQAYRVTFADQEVSGLESFGPSVTVDTDANGFAVSDLRLPELQDDETGGPVLVAVDDGVETDGGDLSSVLGTWTTLTGRRALLLGDGFAEEKPVGKPLEMRTSGIARGTELDVQLARDGEWVSVSEEAGRCADSTAVCTVAYEVPRGLPATGHDVRLVSTSSGTVLAGWTVTPSADGVTAPRIDVEALPPVGGAVEGALGEGGATSNPVPRPRGESLDLPELPGEDVSDPGSASTVALGVALLFAGASVGALLRSRSGRHMPTGRRRA